MHNRFIMGAAFGILGLAACTATHPRPEPVDFVLELAIAGATLGEECGGAGAGIAEDCAPDARGGCGFGCEQSNVSLAITADADRGLALTVVRATLLSADGAELMELSTANPRMFEETAYQAWDETIPTPTEGMNVLYDLHDLDWSGVTDPWSGTYKVRLVVDVEGHSYTLTSDEVARQAPIVT